MRRFLAFTLVELLVVVAAVALLVAVLLPSLRRARNAARSTLCATQLRNVTFALEYYAQDQAGWYPPAEPEHREPVSELHWFMNRELMRYVNVPLCYDADGNPLGPPAEPSALTCPLDDGPLHSREGIEQGYALSYGMNVTFGIGGRPNNTDYRRRAEFEFPALVLAFTDADSASVAPGVVSYHACGKDNFDYRHGDGVNAAFLDAHITRLAPYDIPFGFDRRYEAFWSAKLP
jgi:prepilin-type processing-associated H-X9-DG protein